MAGTVEIDRWISARLSSMLILRGKTRRLWSAVTWVGLHHNQFNELAALKVGEKMIKQNMCIPSLFILGGYLTLHLFSGSHHGQLSNVPSVEQQLPDAYSCSSKIGRERYGTGWFSIGTSILSVWISHSTLYGEFRSRFVITYSWSRLKLSHLLVQTQSDDATADIELTDEYLLLVPTVIFGFSLPLP